MVRQAILTDLLTRWRVSLPCRIEGENSVGIVGGCAATTAGSQDSFGDGEVTREKTGADSASEESTLSDCAHSFWSSLSLIELAEAQDVAPVDDLEGIAALWPSDDDPDELLDHVLAERAARRRGSEAARTDECRSAAQKMSNSAGGTRSARSASFA